MKRFLITLYDNNTNSIQTHVYTCADISDARLLSIKMCSSTRACLLSLKQIPSRISDAELSAYCKLEKKRVKELMKTAIAQEG